MAVPKRKIGHARKSKRKAGQPKQSPATLVTCPNCQEAMQAHHICPSCGFYKGKEVVSIEEE